MTKDDITAYTKDVLYRYLTVPTTEGQTFDEQSRIRQKICELSYIRKDVIRDARFDYDNIFQIFKTADSELEAYKAGQAASVTPSSDLI